VKVREVALVELQKRITDGDSRLKQQQALYEAVRADRNMYSKSLIEAQVGAEVVQRCSGEVCLSEYYSSKSVQLAQPALVQFTDPEICIPG
jgi:hypothetical protein